ncbi:hypothetical protein F0562_006685 [Nyssa sinensis]|uniref:Pectate lyase superfamily protein domain-containing protein n=1 Tax=Nyssa sinensis TaxID=561372 RepID=A0A5J5AMG6_9ASTE|nr:hypothetical protein F0562_006685 [Nyssa sinensis]
MVNTKSFLLVAFLFTFFNKIVSTAVTYNVVNLGAIADGKTDSTKSFLSAWAAACDSAQAATIYVPPGSYLLGKASFDGGQCKNSAITIRIDGTLLAPSDYSVIGKAGNWLVFEHVNGVSIYGGTLDAQGTGLWACKSSGKSCPTGATTLEFSNSKNIFISGLSSINSQKFHIVINAGQNAQGTTNLWIENIACGPGHGISIGSLGKEMQEDGVQNVTVKTVTFTGTENGVRIKTWGRASNGFVRGVVFQHATMVNVQNPILIDQNYCPGNDNCPGQASGVKISDVAYEDIHGSSATEVAVKFDCSKKNPCSGITLEDVKLTYRNKPAQASCANAGGSSSGLVQPTSCL